MQTDQPIQLELLGRFRLHRNDQNIRLPAGKAMLVLAFLACARDRTARRDRLASLFWQESDVEQARASLRQALSRLRAVLGDAREALWSDNDQIGLTRTYWSIDIDALIACEAQESAIVNPSWAATFLSGVHRRDPSIDAWLESERHRLQQVVGRVFQTEIDKALSAGDADRALELGIRLNTLDPFAEPVHRSVMLAYELKGDRANALRQYRTLVRMLDEGLGVAPDEETRALFERLRQHSSPIQRSASSIQERSDTTGRISLDSLQSAQNAFGSSLTTDDHTGLRSPQSNTNTLTGLRLVAVLALRQDDLNDTVRVKANINTLALQQGGEPILSYGAESLFVFGLDVTHSSCIEAALRTTRQVQNNTELGPKLTFGCASGLVSFDENGHPTGSVVQRAARLALLADDGEFIIDRAVYTQLSTQIDVIEVTLRNQVAYRVVNSQVNRPASAPELFGRRVELAQLRRFMKDTETHGAAMAVVSGEAGMGKTHLMLSVEQIAELENRSVLRIAFSTHDDSRGSLSGKLTRLLYDALIQSGANTTFSEMQQTTLSRLLARQRETTQRPWQDNEQQLRFDLMVAMIDRLSSTRPLLLIAEDCHWADAADIELLIDLIDSQLQKAVMLVATERRENETVAHVLQTRVNEVEVLSLSLTPLSRTDARALVESRVKDEYARQRILGRAGGHPLFLTQLVLADLKPDAPVPETVLALVQRELDRSTERTRTVCLKVSILGMEFSLVTLETLFPDIDRIDLLQSSLILMQDNRLCFRHALIHEAIYALLSPDDKANLHHQAAEHFRQINPGEYAHHAFRSGDVEMAIEASVAASEWLLSENRHRQTERMIEQGLLLDPEGDALARLLLSRMHVLRDQGNLEAAIAASRQAHDCAVDAGLRVQALIHAATLLKRRNQTERVAAQLHQASQIANEQDIPDSIRAELEHEWGNHMFMCGEADRCREHHQRSQQLAEQSNDICMQAAALGGLGDAYYAGGRVQSAHRHYSKCVQLADSSDLKLIAIAHRAMLGYTANIVEPGPLALDILFKAVDEARLWKNAQYEILACLHACEWLALANRVEEFATFFQRLRELQSTFGGQRFGPDMCHVEALNAWIMGDLEKARRIAIDGVRDFGGDVYMGALLQALLAAVTDDESAADKALSAGQSLLSDGGLVHNRTNFALFASACHWRRGDFKQALSVIEQAQQQFGPEPVGLLDVYAMWIRTASKEESATLDTARTELEFHNLGVLAITHPPACVVARTSDTVAQPATLH